MTDSGASPTLPPLNPVFNKLPRTHPVTMFACCFGVGFSKFAPGTMGSLVALPLGYFIHLHLGGKGVLMAAAFAFLIGWWASSRYLYATNEDDPKEVVIDEVAGQLLLCSVGFATLQSYFACFVCFRIFDIFKPWPVSWADRRVMGGLGIMLDDILAGFYPIALLLIVFIVTTLTDYGGILEPIVVWLSGNW